MQPKIPLWANRTLIWRLSQREIAARFRASFLGLFWAVTVPLATLAIYSVVFGTVFKARWVNPINVGPVPGFHFPMLMFLGLILFGIMSEPLNRATGLILENVTYVKKVVFPLEILPVVALVSSLVTAAISFVVFLAVYLVLYGLPPVTILLLPFVILPLLLVTLGIVYFLSSVGVFIRDLSHVVPLLTTALLFLSSVFTPPEAVPEHVRLLFYLNPLTLSVNHARDVVFWGRLPNSTEWLVYFLLSVLVCVIGAYWFTRTEKAFADVV